MLVALLVTAATTIVGLLTGASAFAAGFNQDMSDGAAAARGLQQVADLSATFQTISSVLLFIVGAISVIMLIIGGLRYVVSGGDSAAVQGAKNTILYAIVGIIVALLAYAAVSFVINSFASTGSAAGAVPATNG